MLRYPSSPNLKKEFIKKIEVSVEIHQSHLIRVISNALKPDFKKDSRLYINLKVSYKEKKIILSLKGKDISQIRASINSNLRLIGLILMTLRDDDKFV
jgi:tRNA threonylcarbamoyladenosine modification (KEOPS) complex  Pcc1 subunit